MEYREIIEGVRIPVLGLGTWGVGGRKKANRSRDDAEVEALRAGIELGMTHIDTAEYYGNGHAEELVGVAIEPYDRIDLFITTKVWPSHLHYDDLIDSMRASLRRLGLDYVDLYLIHWPNPEIPLEETMRALEHCAKDGYTRHIGVSNFPSSLVEEAQSHLREHRLVADQVEYSLVEQDPQSELLPYCQLNDVTLIAYTPIAKGRLALPGNEVLDGLAEKYGKTQAQVSLNWLIGQEKVVAIPKASNPRHLQDNVGAVGWRMSEEDSERLARAFAKV
ncbi:MAG: aldo/keto reductase [Candidatus Bathyarchaeia archaeon]